MVYQNTDELIRKLLVLNKVEATKKLTEFYAKARFKIRPENFNRQYTDGADDGGIDFYHDEDTTFFIFQTKFLGNPKRASASEMLEEIRKIKSTLTNENPNKKAEDFVNAVKRETGNKDAILEILWLTTNIVEQSIREEIQTQLIEWRKENNWSIGIDFVAIDKYALENVIYDIEHGYIPYTGKKTIKLEQGQWIETAWEETGVRSIICTVNVNSILQWFRNSDDIDKFLQKNIRGFIGDTKVNKDIGKSYLKYPAWFWYKHNGIIIFADNLSIDEINKELILRNPQVVNGGQTIKSLFQVYDKNNRTDNSAKVILRVYRLPYENTETHKKSIEIIKALNFQNKISASDLHSTDPRQVRLEQLLEKIGTGYKYLRKRSKELRASRYSITMKNLSIRYYVCKKNAPHEGVRSNIDELFEEDTKYNEIFDENAIMKALHGSHVVISYVTCWNIDQILQKIELPQRDGEYFQYTKWFVLADIYKKLMDWKQENFNLGWQMWVDFIESYHFEKAILDYSRSTFRIGREIIPALEDPHSFFKTKEAVNKFGSKVSVRNFESLVNKSFNRFQRENK